MDEEREAGTFEIEFEARGMAEGSYLCILQADDFVQVKKLTVLKVSL